MRGVPYPPSRTTAVGVFRDRCEVQPRLSRKPSRNRAGRNDTPLVRDHWAEGGVSRPGRRYSRAVPKEYCTLRVQNVPRVLYCNTVVICNTPVAAHCEMLQAHRHVGSHCCSLYSTERHRTVVIFSHFSHSPCTTIYMTGGWLLLLPYSLVNTVHVYLPKVLLE